MKQILLLLLLGWLLFTRCVPAAETAAPSRETDTTQVTLQFAISGSPSKGYSIDPNLLANVNVYAFYTATGQLASYQYIDNQEACQISVSAGNSYTFYAIANTGKLGVQSRAQVVGYRHSLSQASDLAKGSCVLLCGQYTSLISGDVVLPLTLERATARIQLDVDTSALADGITLSFTAVRLRDVAAQVSCFTPSGVTSTTQICSTGESLSGAELDALYHSGVYLYTYENRQGTLLPDNTHPALKVPPAAQQGLCTYVELEAMYESPTRRGTIRYRFYVGSDHLTNFDLVRNTNYRIHATFTGSGIDEVSWRVVTQDLFDRPQQITVQPASYVFDDYDFNTTLTANVAPATVLPSYAGVTWHSSHPDIASVDAQGKVTSHTAGHCLITATSTDVPSLYGSAEVTVNEPNYSIRIVRADSILYCDSDKTVRNTWQVELTPASSRYTPLWETSDSAVATAFEYASTSSVFTMGTGQVTLRAIHPKDRSVRDSVQLSVVQPRIEIMTDTVVTLNPNGTSAISARLIDGVPGDSLQYNATMSPLITVSPEGMIRASWQGISDIDISARYATPRFVRVYVEPRDLSAKRLVHFNYNDLLIGDTLSLFSWDSEEPYVPAVYYYSRADNAFMMEGAGQGLPNVELFASFGLIYNQMNVRPIAPTTELFRHTFTNHYNNEEHNSYIYLRAKAEPFYCHPIYPQLTLPVGTSTALSYSTNNAEWTRLSGMTLYSSNPQVATVDWYGTVRAVSTGTTVVNMYHPTSGLLRVWEVTVTP